MRRVRNTLATVALLVSTGLATQASAIPIFTFTEYGGFTADVGMAKYSNPVTGDADLVPAAGALYSTMSWVGGRPTRSSLDLETVTTPTALAADTWTTISTLYHHNERLQSANSWVGQDIWGRFVLSDADGGVSKVLDSDHVITVNMTETKNNHTCDAPNPIGSTCDDYFTLTTPIDDLFFSANDGSQWLATFRFANLINAVQLANLVFTGEGMTSSVDVQVLVTSLDNIGIQGMSRLSAVTEVPEPATLITLCMGLFALGIARLRTAAQPSVVPARSARS